MNVLGIGETVLDKSILLSSFACEGTKMNAQKEVISIGGPIPTALILLARLGVRCTLVTTLGNDDHGKAIKKTLTYEGIEVISRTTNNTKNNLVLTNCENGSRTIIKSTVVHKKITHINKKLIEQADVIIVDRHEPLVFDQIVKHKNPTTKIIIDPSTEVSAHTAKMIAHAEFPIVPIEASSSLTLRENLVITAGEQGSYLYSQNKLVHLPAYKVQVVDTLGAGDIFRGAFAYGVLKKWKVSKCVAFANLVSALQCSKPGNATAIPTKKEIDVFKKSAVQIKHASPISISKGGIKYE